MKTTLFVLVLLLIVSCNCHTNSVVDVQDTSIEGTWKLFYGSIEQNDSLEIKDVSKSDFIKIINDSHFAFFNQVKGSAENFYGGAGTYTLDGNIYIESLNYIRNTDLRSHKFPFTIELKGDTLIQHGHEKVEAAQIDRYIVEKYLRVN